MGRLEARGLYYPAEGLAARVLPAPACSGGRQPPLASLGSKLCPAATWPPLLWLGSNPLFLSWTPAPGHQDAASRLCFWADPIPTQCRDAGEAESPLVTGMRDLSNPAPFCGLGDL